MHLCFYVGIVTFHSLLTSVTYYCRNFFFSQYIFCINKLTHASFCVEYSLLSLIYDSKHAICITGLYNHRHFITCSTYPIHYTDAKSSTDPYLQFIIAHCPRNSLKIPNDHKVRLVPSPICCAISLVHGNEVCK